MPKITLESTRNNRQEKQKWTKRRKLLRKQLCPAEVEVVMAIAAAPSRASRLGWTESLIARGWLDRDESGMVSLSEETKQLFAECAS